jgi:glutathione S-transferase
MPPSLDLVLWGESGWVSPWVFHVMVGLEEKRLPYRLELVPLPIPADMQATFRAKSILGKVPILVHGDRWLSESLAITEYLAETFPSPDHPRLFPADLGDRARARQIMSMLRTSLFGLREDRPTSSVFGPALAPAPALSPRGAADAAELCRIASAVIAPGATTLFDAWCIADADLALALMRLVHNGDPVPDALATYARANWARPSVATYLAHAGRT